MSELPNFQVIFPFPLYLSKQSGCISITHTWAVCDWQVTHSRSRASEGREKQADISSRYTRSLVKTVTMSHSPLSAHGTHVYKWPQPILPVRKRGWKVSVAGWILSMKTLYMPTLHMTELLTVRVKPTSLLSDNTKQINLNLDRFGLAQFQSSNTELTGCLHCTEAYSKAERPWDRGNMWRILLISWWAGNSEENGLKTLKTRYKVQRHSMTPPPN